MVGLRLRKRFSHRLTSKIKKRVENRGNLTKLLTKCQTFEVLETSKVLRGEKCNWVFIFLTWTSQNHPESFREQSAVSNGNFCFIHFLQRMLRKRMLRTINLSAAKPATKTFLISVRRGGKDYSRKRVKT